LSSPDSDIIQTFRELVDQDLEPVSDRLLAFDYGILDDRVPQINEKLHRMDIEDDDATDLATVGAKSESRLVDSI
jgi:hypothetical protein